MHTTSKGNEPENAFKDVFVKDKVDKNDNLIIGTNEPASED